MSKIRLFVLTDISSLTSGVGEPDDTQSLVRLLLYSNEVDIVGLAATYTKHTVGVNAGFIREVISRYAQVRDNLLKHAGGFPTADELLGRVAEGNPTPGLSEVGEGKDTGASRAIIARADESDSPLWITAWGGVTDLAQAVWRVNRDRSPQEAQEFISKLRVYSIGDQYDDCGPWLRENFKSMFYIISQRAYRGMYRKGDETLVGREWVESMLKGKGPLSEIYPTYDGGDIYTSFYGRLKGVKEGDSPSFMHLLQPNLNDPEQPEQGGWGGRFARIPGSNAFSDAMDSTVDACDEWVTVYRHRRDFQADFAARMHWCVLPAEKGARKPDVRVVGDAVRAVRYGEDFTLECEATHPKGEPLSISWEYYHDASSYKGRILMRGANMAICTVRVPGDGQSEAKQAHFILKVWTQGAEYIPAYARVIVNLFPQSE